MPATSPATTAAVATRTVVVADDTAFVRDRFRAALEAGGHRALTARSGPDLIAQVRAGLDDLDLVVLDLRLPGAHGLQLVRALRALHPDRPPIVVFSGTIASAAEVRQLAALGIAGYVNEYTAAQHILRSLAPHLFPDHYNRRSSPRVVLGIPVSYRFGNTIAAALTLNISEGGLAIRTTSPLDVGATLRLRFRVPTARADVDAVGRVAWVDRRIGMGVQFTALSAEDQATVDDFVQSHFFTNRKA
jgi:uncharacterized protein (TIGR02266 family)